MSIAAENIKPAVRGKSDFFSWQLYRYCVKHPNPSEQKVWLSTWNSISASINDHTNLYIGSDRDGDWIHARQLRNLCLSGQSIERYAYGAFHGTKNWVDCTEQFWSDYMKKGVCAIHGDYAHSWRMINARNRFCEYCGKAEQKKIVNKPQEIWFECSEDRR